MEKLYYIVDIDRCWGCKSCQTACLTEHGYEPKSGWPIEVFRIENISEKGEAACDFVPVLCQHCDSPACLAVCGPGVISKGEDGLVSVDETACIGCGKCVEVCAYGAILPRRREDGKQTVMKCDLCPDRRARGFLPSCGQHCMGGVFRLCAESDKERVLSAYRYSWSTGQVLYVSNILSEIGTAL